MNDLDILEGVTYHNGKGKQRTVVGFNLYFVLYKTPTSKRTTAGVPIWDFKKWAKGAVEESVSND